MADNFFEQFTDEKEPNFFEEFTEEPPSDDSGPVVTKVPPVEEVTTDIDPAVQEEINNRKLLIDIVGIDPNTGKFVNNYPRAMVPGFNLSDVNQKDIEKLNKLYPSIMPKTFNIKGEPTYLGFGPRKDIEVNATQADEVFTYSDGRQEIAPIGSQLIISEDGRDILIPPGATDDQIEQAKLTGTFQPKVELPDASRQMYDSFPATDAGREAAMSLYNAYAAVGSTNAIGAVEYNGLIVPRPDMASGLVGGAPDLDFQDDVTQAMYNGAKNTLITLSAINDLLANSVYEGINTAANAAIEATNEVTGLEINELDLKSDLVSVVDEAIPSFPKDSSGVVDGLVFEGTQIVAGGIAGAKIGDRILEGIGRISNLFSKTRNSRSVAKELVTKYAPKSANATKAISTEAGMAAALDPDVQTIFAGENAMLPLGFGIEVDPSDPAYKQIIAKKANILADAVIAARGLQTVAEATARSAKIVYLFSGASTIRGALSVDARQEAFVDNILQMLTQAVEPGVTGQRAVEIQRQLVKTIQDNSEVLTRIDDEEVAIGLSTLAAIQRAYRSGDTDVARRILSTAQRLEQGSLSKSPTSQLAVKQGAPGRALAEETERMFDSRGGATGVNQAGDSIRAEALAPIQQGQLLVDAAELSQTQFAERVAREIDNNPLVGEKLDQLRSVDGVSVVIDRNASMDSIMKSLFEAATQMTKKKDELFSKIKGGQLNRRDADGVQFGEQLYDVLLDVNNKDFLNPANNIKPGTTQVAELLQAVSKMDREEAIAFLSNKVTFEDLYTKIRPNLADRLSSLKQEGSNESLTLMQDLLALKRLIDDDAILYLDDTGQTKILGSAQEAMDYYKGDYSTFWRDGGILQDVHRVNSSGISQAGPLDAARNAVEGGLTDANRLQGDNIIKVLMSEEGGGNVNDLYDYIIGDAVAALDTQAGKALEEISFAPVRQKLMDRASILDNNPSTKPTADRIRTFLKDMARLEKVTPELSAKLENAKANLVRIKEDTYKGVLGKFFKDGEIRPNTQEVLNDYFKDRDSLGIVYGKPAGPLVDLMATISKMKFSETREKAQLGVQAAFAKFFREKFLIATKEIPNQRGVSEAKINQELGDITNFLDKASIIFRDRPENVEGLRTMLELAGVQVGARKATTGAGNSITADKAEAITAVNKLVTLTFGALSRLGARIRSGATSVISERLDPAGSAMLAEQLLTNPKEFLEIAKKVIPKEGQGMRQDQIDLFYAWAVRSNIYDTAEGDGQSEEDFMMAVADFMATSEETLGGINAQMRNLLPK